MKLSSFFTLPILLTLFRLVFSPFLLPVLLVTFIPYNLLWVNVALAIVFMLVSFTDFLDGYLARRLGQESEFGKVLDPIADKFLLYSTLVALLAVNRIYYYWVIILIGREFFIMGLRLVAAENNLEMQVSKFGKCKTAVQFLYLTLVILHFALMPEPYAYFFSWLQQIMLLGTLLLTLISAYLYYRAFISTINMRTFEGDF